ncbi:LOW QUALITY PROTEIN: olfactory receptor 5A1-like [Chelonoidis abingdonii]|uniref:LOW QUALITY PROTEIN: olfactory receptor 5A1-like n=1 Tax=Chelonoidis abingdonii TaxID=106734 RepID=UPI0013F1F95A|nr:LOW QUALITY PROTEIN: olfactory receptor 5A1-like [Chelonoidis abingdonii]
MENQTTVAKIILLGILIDPQLQVFLFLVFLVIYVITLLGNMVIMLMIKVDPHLQSPMHFFLSHLSFLCDICYSSIIVPKMLENFLAEKKTISASGCITQMFFIILSSGAEIFTLAAMAYDRYAAICDSLHYMETMKKRLFQQLVMGAWIIGFIDALVNTIPLLKLHFCGPSENNHFTCKLPSLLVLSCTETFSNEVVLLSSIARFGSSSFLLTLVSYIYIIATILRIHSMEGKRKAFSTCSSHLLIVILDFGTGSFRYVRPSSVSSKGLDMLVSIQYSFLTPMLNPIIYSLKNKEMKRAMVNMLKKAYVSHGT